MDRTVRRNRGGEPRSGANSHTPPPPPRRAPRRRRCAYARATPRPSRKVIRLIEKLSTDGSDRPRVRVVITNCGQIGAESAAAAGATQPLAVKEPFESTAAAPGPAIEAEEDGNDAGDSDDDDEVNGEQLAGMSEKEQVRWPLGCGVGQA